MLGGILAGLAAGALWGLVFVAPKLVPSLSVIDLVAGRYFFYGLTSAAVMVVQAVRRPLPTMRQALVSLGLSVLGFSGYYFLLVLAIRGAGPKVPTLIIGMIPIWVMLLGKPEHLQWRQLLPGLLLTIAGVLLMMDLPTMWHRSDAIDIRSYSRGIAFALAAMVSWTAFAVLNASWLKKHQDISTTDWANWMGVGAGMASLGLWFAIGSDAKDLLALTDIAQIAIVCIATGAGSGWLATVLWNRASRVLSASLCGQLIVSETLFGLFFAFLLVGQWPSASQILATFLFVMGVVASIRAHR
jgi:drug/metabolite transporter (DMT)-like permease